MDHFGVPFLEEQMREHRIKCGSRSLLDLGYTDDMTILDENARKINEFLEIEFRVQE